MLLNCFLNCWRKLLRVPWTARKSNQSVLRKSVLNINWKDQCWSWNTNILAAWSIELTHLKSPWCRERWKAKKGMAEDEMVGWHHQLNGHEFEWTPGVGDGQGGLACCSSWGCKESGTTEWPNWTNHFVNSFHTVISRVFFVDSLKILFLLYWAVYNCAVTSSQ